MMNPWGYRPLGLILLCVLIWGCETTEKMIQSLPKPTAEPSQGSANPEAKPKSEGIGLSDPLSFLVPAKPLQDGAEMKELQTLLNRIGKQYNFNAGTPNGVFGGKTGVAISAFQRLEGSKVDGKPTDKLLRSVRKVAKTGFGDAVSKQGKAQTEFDIKRCMSDSDLASMKSLASNLFDQAASQLPVDIKPYLAGFCMPDDEKNFKSAFLYFVAHGALHARLTLVKYDELVRIYSAAGVDLGIHKDAFRRSIETLPADVKLLAEDREAGTARLLSNYNAEDARTFLNNLPAAYKQLEEKYRREGKEMMSEALGHSGSSTFYLSRSSFMAQQLLSLISLSGQGGGQSIWDKMKFKVDRAQHGAGIATFVGRKRKDLTSMLTSVVYGVKALKQDIKDIPPEYSKASQEVADFQRCNGVKLDDFEREFSRTNLFSSPLHVTKCANEVRMRAQIGIEIKSSGRTKFARQSDRRNRSDRLRIYVIPQEPAYVYIVYSSGEQVRLLNRENSHKKIEKYETVKFPAEGHLYHPGKEGKKEVYTIICSHDHLQKLIDLTSSNKISYQEWMQYESALVEKNKIELAEKSEKPIKIAGGINKPAATELPLISEELPVYAGLAELEEIQSPEASPIPISSGRSSLIKIYKFKINE